MPTLDEMQRWRDLDVEGADGEKIGSLDAIYLDRESGEPEWLAVNTGLFGMSSSFVPSAEARREGDRVVVPYSKDVVKDAPNVDADGDLTPDEERRLYEHYGIAWGDFDYDAGPVGHDTSGPETDTAMTRSEEEVVVGKRSEETGRARLRKYVVTDEVETTVPVAREEVRVEREPITEGNVDEAMEGPPIHEEEHEVTLHAEEPVVEKRVVPQERVRLEKEERVEERPVSEEVRREEIETDAPRRR